MNLFDMLWKLGDARSEEYSKLFRKLRYSSVALAIAAIDDMKIHIESECAGPLITSSPKRQHAHWQVNMALIDLHTYLEILETRKRSGKRDELIVNIASACGQIHIVVLNALYDCILPEAEDEIFTSFSLTKDEKCRLLEYARTRWISVHEYVRMPPLPIEGLTYGETMNEVRMITVYGRCS